VACSVHEEIIRVQDPQAPGHSTVASDTLARRREVRIVNGRIDRERCCGRRKGLVVSGMGQYHTPHGFGVARTESLSEVG